MLLLIQKVMSFVTTKARKMTKISIFQLLQSSEMSENVYFACSAIIAPELSSIQVVISIGGKDITINPHRSRRDPTRYFVRYKTIEKLLVLPNFGYDRIVFKVTFFGPNSQPTASGKIELDHMNLEIKQLSK